MWLIDLEAPPQRLRGLLARWGVEVRAGLYVGDSSVRTRDSLWTLVTEELGATGNAVMVFDSSSVVQGFEFRTWGPNRREIFEIDGLYLARFKPAPASELAPPTDGDDDPDATAETDLGNESATLD